MAKGAHIKRGPEIVSLQFFSAFSEKASLTWGLEKPVPATVEKNSYQ
jgi:hypothetical protein